MKSLIEYFNDYGYSEVTYRNFYILLRSYDTALYRKDITRMIDVANYLSVYMFALSDVFSTSRLRDHKEELEHIIANNYFEVKDTLN